MGKSGFNSGFWNVIQSGKIQNRAFIQGFDKSIERLDQIEKDFNKLLIKESNEAEKELRDRV